MKWMVPFKSMAGRYNRFGSGDVSGFTAASNAFQLLGLWKERWGERGTRRNKADSQTTKTGNGGEAARDKAAKKKKLPTRETKRRRQTKEGQTSAKVFYPRCRGTQGDPRLKTTNQMQRATPYPAVRAAVNPLSPRRRFSSLALPFPLLVLSPRARQRRSGRLLVGHGRHQEVGHVLPTDLPHGLRFPKACCLAV